MPLLIDLFTGLSDVARVMVVLSLVSIAGLALGQVTIGGVGLGIGGVLFAGIAAGHLAASAGVEFDHHVLHFVREFGLILFVYTIGIQVGPGFFAALKRSGLGLNLMALAVVGLGTATAAAIHLVTGTPLAAVLGVYSGAVTNTPSLAAGQEILHTVGAPAGDLALPGLGYAVTYPFGIAGILLTMALIRGVFRIDAAAEGAAYESRRRAEVAVIETLDVAVRNPAAAGRTVRELLGSGERGVVASRMMRGGTLQVPLPGTVIEPGDVLHLVGPATALQELKGRLGTESDITLTTRGTDMRWERLVVTADAVLGKSIAGLAVNDTYGVVISRVTRAGVELVPSSALKLQFGDILTAIGKPADIARVAQLMGNSQRRLQQVEYIPVFIGILLGIILGSIPLYVPGMPAPMKLGLAGGPLLAALVLSRVGHAGPLVWFMPPAANAALREIGIVLFLAVVGVMSGGRFMETLVEGDGLAWMLYGALITVVPLLIVGFLARAVWKLNYLTACGVLAGSMTDPPALAFANGLSPSQAAALAYATVYPLVMCLRILAPQLLVLLLW
ncbi:putative transporter [Azospirillum halopraeferens]|uniref:putative transporter n=1 Tax=Azospirillum halopraeferens TaxID=34010 RepID=UPI000410EA18|nr:putative transporter [Azospirillum halopraeferens]